MDGGGGLRDHLSRSHPHGHDDRDPDDQRRELARRRTVLGRYGEPEEVAQITLSLVLPAASYITGAVIPVDGGLTIRNA